MSQTKIKNKIQNEKHVPVLLREVVDQLKPKHSESYLDLTAGYGGHAQSIISATQGNATLVDRDENAVAVLYEVFSTNNSVHIVHESFLDAAKRLIAGEERFDMILADLGVSSPHLDNAHRGFSFAIDAPLDMRMNPRQSLSAMDVVNTYTTKELVRILREYGEEPKAERMALKIVEARPLTSTLQLAAIAKQVWPGHSKVHPATRLFQAVRIEVNDELGQLEKMIPLALQLLKPGGRLSIITFHSLEDRIVKRFFKQVAGDRYDADFLEVSKKPAVASLDERAINPRARSAKLRTVRKRK